MIWPPFAESVEPNPELPETRRTMQRVISSGSPKLADRDSRKKLFTIHHSRLAGRSGPRNPSYYEQS